MGKKGSTLVPFLIEGLKSDKYVPYLKYVSNENHDIFEVTIPRKTKNLNCESMGILNDWLVLKGLKLKTFGYTKAKQRLQSALRRSVFLERLLNSNKYRILSPDEIKVKKDKMENAKKLEVEEYSSPSSVESLEYDSHVESPISTNHDSDCEIAMSPLNTISIPDYDSGIESPTSFDNCNDHSNLLAGIQHDYNFGFNTNNEEPVAKEKNEHKENINDAFLPELDESLSSDLSTESLYQFCAQILENDRILLDGSVTEPKSIEIEKKNIVCVKKYTYKSLIPLHQTYILICEPKEEISFDESFLQEVEIQFYQSLLQNEEILIDKSGFRFILDETLRQIVGSFDWKDTECRDNHLFLYVEPKNISVENF